MQNVSLLYASACRKRHALGGTHFCLLRRSEIRLVAVAPFLQRVCNTLAKIDRCPCSASPASAAGSGSASQSPNITLLDKIQRRTVHSAWRPRTLSALKVAVAQISIARRSALVNLDGCPSSASLVSAAGSSSASLSCMCPVHPHMSAGQDFFDSLFSVSKKIPLLPARGQKEDDCAE